MTGASREIGGYFPLEVSKGGNVFHRTPYALNSGRSALYCILTCLQPSVVYIPFYSCDALLDAFGQAQVEYRFYEIDRSLEPAALPDLASREYFLYVNYFDLKRGVVDRLSRMFRDRLIVDATLSYFITGNGQSWFFNSCRKFFGVPDGSFLYPPDNCEIAGSQPPNEDYLVDHLVKGLDGRTREGYRSFLANEALCGGPPRAMSRLTEYLLSRVDHSEVIRRRRENYACLDRLWRDCNALELEVTGDSVPMAYPLLLPEPLDRERLYANDLFIPVLWKEVLTRRPNGFDLERAIAANLYPLPVDHRYDCADMIRMATAIRRMYE